MPRRAAAHQQQRRGGVDAVRQELHNRTGAGKGWLVVSMCQIASVKFWRCRYGRSWRRAHLSRAPQAGHGQSARRSSTRSPQAPPARGRLRVDSVPAERQHPAATRTPRRSHRRPTARRRRLRRLRSNPAATRSVASSSSLLGDTLSVPPGRPPSMAVPRSSDASLGGTRLRTGCRTQHSLVQCIKCPGNATVPSSGPPAAPVGQRHQWTARERLLSHRFVRRANRRLLQGVQPRARPNRRCLHKCCPTTD